MAKRTIEELKSIILKELGAFGILRQKFGWKAVSGKRSFLGATQEEAAEKLAQSIGK